MTTMTTFMTAASRHRQASARGLSCISPRGTTLVYGDNGSACSKAQASSSCRQQHVHQTRRLVSSLSSLSRRRNQSFLLQNKNTPYNFDHSTDSTPLLSSILPSSSIKRRAFSAIPTSSSSSSSLENTALGGPKATSLLQGLDVHTVPAEDDEHPLAVYTIDEDSLDPTMMMEMKPHDGQDKPRMPLLLLHGRTWSSLPVYHLMGGGGNLDTVKNNNNNNNNGGSNNSSSHDSRSLMEALYNTHNIQPYAMDFRGFGGTPKDDSGFVEPSRCVLDVISVLNWIDEREKERNLNSGVENNNGKGADGDDGEKGVMRPALLGWSQGAMIAQLVAQRRPDALSKLILYASIYNPNIKYPIPPPPPNNEHDPTKGHTDHDDFPLFEEGLAAIPNEFDGAMEDFTNVGPPIPARLFAESALITDPIKVQWWNLHQLNECHPSLVNVPTMVIAGDMDPYASIFTQVELFTNLGRGVDRVWSVIGNADHAVHLSDERSRFVEKVRSFLDTKL